MLFSIVKGAVISSDDLNHDLDIICHWAHQWKMEFNPEPTKQATRANYKQTVVADQFDRQNLFSADQSWIFPDHNFSNPDPNHVKRGM